MGKDEKNEAVEAENEPKVNYRLNRLVEGVLENNGGFLDEKQLRQLYLMQYIKDLRAGELEEYSPDEIEALNGLLDDWIKDLINGTGAKKEYRTAGKAREDGVIATVPDTIANPTLAGLVNSLGLLPEGEAFLQPLIVDTRDLKFENGKLYFDTCDAMRAMSRVEIQKICPDHIKAKYQGRDDLTKEELEELEQACKVVKEIDLPLLRTLYSILLSDYVKKTDDEKQEYKGEVTIYLPDLAAALGYGRNVSEDQIEKIVRDSRRFHNLMGVFSTPRESYYAMLNFNSYDKNTNTLKLSSPYLSQLIRKVDAKSKIKDKAGNIVFKKSGEPRRLPAHSRLIETSIAAERNKSAVENVFIIVQVIERAGSGDEACPNISARELIERNRILTEQLNGSANQGIVLKRAFTKTWELLRDKTHLTEAYKNIVIPDPDDDAFIPTKKNVAKLIFSFPHDGKNKKWWLNNT